MFKVNTPNAVKEVRKAYQEKRLGMQHRSHNVCQYDYGNGHVCAIGAFLSKDILDLLIKEDVVEAGLGQIADWFIEFESLSVQKHFLVLQRCHDKAAVSFGADDYAMHLQNFEDQLGIMEVKYVLS